MIFNLNMMKIILLLFCINLSFLSGSVNDKKTTVTIKGNQFFINGELTYKGRYWKGNKIEGLLLNSRMVQGIFDDLNPKTREKFVYPDTKVWDADRNTKEFVSHMEEWRKYGLLAFTLNLQGGSPVGYGNSEWINSGYTEKGELRPDYMARLEQILNKADELNMVVILGYFYFGQDQYLENEQAVLNATDNITNWILNKGYRNILIEINNECNIEYDHKILQPERVAELIRRVQDTKKDGFNLLVSASFGGGTIPESSVVSASDFILLHGNGMNNSSQITDLVSATKNVSGYVSQPVVFNEDDHFNFGSDSCNFVAAIKSYASWGYFDYRMDDEGFESGYQSVPVDWGINSERKKMFFKKLNEITSTSPNPVITELNNAMIPVLYDVSYIKNKYLDIPYAALSSAQKLDIYLPDNFSEHLPVIVAIHGGAFMMGDKRDDQLVPVLEGLKRGYAVISINYRMSGEAIFPANIYDVKAAIRWIRANANKYHLNPGRIAVWGDSAGGYLASLAGTSGGVGDLEDFSLGNAAYTSKVQAVIDWYGPINFLTMDEQLRKTGNGKPDHSESQSPESKVLGAKITEIPDLVKRANPETYISADDPPFFIQHGTKDPIVPTQQSEEFYSKLIRVLGTNRVTLKLLKDAGHGGPQFEDPLNLEIVFNFLNKQMQDKRN
jgi:acetyl esterase/lipase